MIKISNRSTKGLIWVATLVIVVIVAVTVIVIYQKESDKVDLPSTKSNQNKPTVTSKKPEPEQTEKMINLPGAKPIKPIEGDYTKDDSLWRLVNKSHPFDDLHYQPSNLALASVPSRTDKSIEERSIRQDIFEPTEKLFADAKLEGIDLLIGSGYRGYDLQNLYYSNYARVYGQESADTFSAKPGYSEHQTGLVVDLATTDQICYLDACFGETKAGQWLAEHTHQYGFILRYPKNKDGITDFIYEPWHFRYVGVELAQALYESGLTLDEATPYLLEPR